MTGPAGEPPIQLPGYRDFTLVAAGGDGSVYRAVHEESGRPVAVKVLASDGEDGQYARQQRELEITVRLGRAHPNIVTVLDSGMLEDGRPCIVMEYCEFGSLQDQLRVAGPLPASVAIAAGTAVADALGFAHSEGVLHRDVKPQNVLVLPSSFVLADFGLARRIDAGHTSSLERFSYRHASPQVLDGELPTVTDDVYSLGSTLFTLLDGRPPFALEDPEADSALAYLRRARSEPPRPIRSSDAPPQLLAIIERCLARRREERFPDAVAVGAALRAVVIDTRWAPAWRPRVVVGGRGQQGVRAGAPRPGLPTSLRTPPPALPAAASARPTASLSASAAVLAAPPAPPRTVTPPPSPSPLPPEPLRFTPVADAGQGGTEGAGWRRRIWPLVPVLAVLAVSALSGGIGLGLWLTGGGSVTTSIHDDTAVHAVPTLTGGLPTGAVQPTVDPALAVEITEFDDQGSSIILAWRDPSAGQAMFVVYRIGDDEQVPILSIDAGTTTAVITGLEPAGRYCYQVLALVKASNTLGTSPVRCTAR